MSRSPDLSCGIVLAAMRAYGSFTLSMHKHTWAAGTIPQGVSRDTANGVLCPNGRTRREGVVMRRDGPCFSHLREGFRLRTNSRNHRDTFCYATIAIGRLSFRQVASVGWCPVGTQSFHGHPKTKLTTSLFIFLIGLLFQIYLTIYSILLCH